MLKYHIQTVELTSAQSVISINNIPQEYNDLLVLVSSRSSSTQEHLLIGFNNSTSDFTGRFLAGSTVTGSGVYARYIGNQMPSGAPANTFSNASIYIPNYQSSAPKSISGEIIGYRAEFSSLQSGISANLWNNTAAINSIQFTNEGGTNFVAGSTISLYGVRRGSDGVTGTPPYATGGTITSSGGYTIHTFNSSGTFTPTKNLSNVDYLVIGGGGGGGSSLGAGGGAGGYRSSVTGQSSGGGASAESKLSLTAGTAYTVTVGAGGGGNTSGSNSVFGSITSVGGGGAGFDSTNGLTGGSGGGSPTGTAGTGTTNQGFGGGTGTTNNPGGGGGAGSVGSSNAPNNWGGWGGDGVSSNITGTAVTRAGGGGGGGMQFNSNGGSGGGGVGQVNQNAGSGVANTGSGGGGVRQSFVYPGGGGSGVVIIRYPN